jgi:hypothetical protein
MESELDMLLSWKPSLALVYLLLRARKAELGVTSIKVPPSQVIDWSYARRKVLATQQQQIPTS